MKVTALIPDDIVTAVRKNAGGKNLTESLIIALQEWLTLKKIKKLNHIVKSSPLSFQEGVTAATLRETNRDT